MVKNQTSVMKELADGVSSSFGYNPNFARTNFRISFTALIAFFASATVASKPG